ncbi:hypothetical protein [Cellulomonas edaphi]|uniref:Recombinase A n=1 Tax=Cellulomonas edaphi TaxID=3053468 RepID=A0ABT7S5W2_9CELL|nr:hypothetical protein [Cellulomons edaphi]MDM7830976.1 hypothetical protein [Cellulomons edaphi]
MPTSTMSREDRAARARAVLAHAELRTGARSVLRPAEGHPVAGERALAAAPAPVPAPAPAPVSAPAPLAAPAAVPVVRGTALITSERPALPVPHQLAEVLPDGLRRGGTTAVLGSTSLVLTLLAHACAGGAWAAVVGQPTVGLLAASQAGVALDRLALVPRPGADAALVLAALVDGLDVVVVGPDVALGEADRRRLSARARERGAVLMPTVAWPGASAVLTVEQARWTGVGTGDGRLRTHSLRVARTGRGSAAVPHVVEVTLPLGSSAPEQVPVEGSAEPAVEPALRLVG